MKVLAPYIVVGFTKEAIDKIFVEGASFKNILAGGDAMLFNSKANPNFISFHHKFQASIGNEIKLEFIDPQGEFEKRYMSEAILPMAGGYLQNSTVSPDYPDTVRTEPQEKQLDDARGFFEQSSQALVNAHGRRKLYLAYGIGDNFETWAGPHVMTMMDAQIKVEGARKITLKLVAEPKAISMGARRGLFNEVIELDLLGNRWSVEARSGEIDFEKYDSGEPLYVPTPTGISYAETDFPIADRVVRYFDIHLVVTAVLRRYIQQITGNSNVIVLLPNLNWICRPTIQAVAELERKEKPEREGGSGGGGSSSNKGECIEEANAMYVPFMEKGWLFSTILKLLSSFGLDFSQIDAESNQNTHSLPAGLLNYLEEQDAATSYEERLDMYFEDWYFCASISSDSTHGFPNYQKKLDEIISLIAANSNGYWGGHVKTFYESDTKILDYWATGEFTESFLFAGKDNAFTEGAAVIFGDLQLIRDYLYAHPSKKTKQRLPLHPTDKKVLDGGSYRNNVRGILFPETRLIGPFGDISYIPTDFSYMDEATLKQAQEEAIKNNLTVLRYNTKNPNVINMDFKYGSVYFSLLQAGFRKEIERKATTGMAEQILDNFAQPEPLDEQDSIDYTSEVLVGEGTGDSDQRQTAIQDAGDTAGMFIGPPPVSELTQLAYAMNDQMIYRDYAQFVINQQKPGNTVKIMEDFVQQLYRKAMEMSVTTVPFFHLSNYSTMNSQIALFAQSSPIIQTKLPGRSPLDAFFTGMYRIVGFEHIINTREAVTKFDLVKNFPQVKSDPVTSQDSLELTPEQEWEKAHPDPGMLYQV